jgi:four helix bundle protein
MEENSKKYDINERLIEFAVNVIAICESVYSSRAGSHMVGQLIRSGTSPALNYGEAQSAESRSDFIHKLKIAVKELRESYNSLRIMERANLASNNVLLQSTLTECNELISILVKSVETAKKNKEKSETNKRVTE